jgi:predicted phosphohydrolase
VTQFDIPHGDVLIHAGDFSRSGMLPDLRHFRAFVDQLPHIQKILVAGNHELTLHSELYATNAKSFHESLFKKKSFNPVEYAAQCRAVMTTGEWPTFSYLQDSKCFLTNPVDSATTDISVYGSPWQPEHCSMAFGLPRGAALREKWDCIPDHTDVIVTHTPPFGILDQATDGTLCGCEDLLSVVKERVRPRLHVFGHIHEGHGEYGGVSHFVETTVFLLTVTRLCDVPKCAVIPNTYRHLLRIKACYPICPGVSYDGTTLFVNAAICDAHYAPTNRAVVVDLPLDKSLPAVVVADGTTG